MDGNIIRLKFIQSDIWAWSIGFYQKDIMLLLPVVLLQYAIRGKKKEKSAKILFHEALGMHYDTLRMHSKCVAFKGRPSKEALLCYLFEYTTKIFGSFWKKPTGATPPTDRNIATKDPWLHSLIELWLNTICFARRDQGHRFSSQSGNLQLPGVQSEAREIESRSGLCKAGAGFL